MRIVSLLPSTTEIVYALGAGEDLVGVSFECDFPPDARTRRTVTGTALPAGLAPGEIDAQVRALLAAGTDLYTLDAQVLRELDPELILTQDLCAVCALDVGTVDEALAHLGSDARVLTVAPSTLADVLASVLDVGAALDRSTAAAELVGTLRRRLDAVTAAVAGRRRPRVAVLEWTDPLYAAGHWVPDMVRAAGADEVLGEPGGRSTPIHDRALLDSEADHVVVAACGFDLATNARLADELARAGRLPAGAQLWAADSDGCFVRPGPRLVDGVEALAAALHRGALPERPDVVRRVIPAQPSPTPSVVVGASTT